MPRGLEAKIVDGDQRLWLRVAAGLTVIVLGFEGEPYLRFSPGGVAVNERSPAFYLNRSRPSLVPRGLNPRASPRWHRLTAGRTYSWHEDRLHGLASAARPSNSSYVGRWTIPLKVAGVGATISGGLWYRDRPSLVWFWPIAVTIASLAALLRLRRRRLDVVLATALVVTTLVASVVGRAGRGVYGRPTVSIGQLIGFAIACLIAVVLGWAFAAPRWRSVATILAGGYGLWTGITLFGTLTHGFVLAALPAWVERTTAVTALAGCVGLWLVLLFGNGFEPEERPWARRVSSRQG
ncbi:MAG: hypothetical protein WBB74_04940 [Gaiellaceae bacterium]